MAIGGRIGDRPDRSRRSGDEGEQAMDLAKPAACGRLTSALR